MALPVSFLPESAAKARMDGTLTTQYRIAAPARGRDETEIRESRRGSHGNEGKNMKTRCNGEYAKTLNLARRYTFCKDCTDCELSAELPGWIYNFDPEGDVIYFADGSSING